MKTNNAIRNITRFTYDFTSFQGWRLAICRKGKHFTRYFSDKQYGSSDLSFRAAIGMRDKILHALQLDPNKPELAFAQGGSSDALKEYPAGISPRKNIALIR